jgi:hypothetical protein
MYQRAGAPPSQGCTHVALNAELYRHLESALCVCVCVCVRARVRDGRRRRSQTITYRNLQIRLALWHHPWQQDRLADVQLVFVIIGRHDDGGGRADDDDDEGRHSTGRCVRCAVCGAAVGLYPVETTARFAGGCCCTHTRASIWLCSAVGVCALCVVV